MDGSQYHVQSEPSVSERPEPSCEAETTPVFRQAPRAARRLNLMAVASGTVRPPPRPAGR